MKKQLLLILIAGLTLATQLLNAQSLLQIDASNKPVGSNPTRGGNPWVEFNDLLTTYYTNVDNFVTCEVYSNGVVDDICGIGYEIYKDNVLVENVSDYGIAYFKVRQEGDVYYTGQITEGSGMIQIEVGEDLIGAFTLGIFDNYCTNRNRPIEFHATTFVPGEYKVVYYIYSCTNSGTSTGTDFTASMCDGLVHQDLVAETCEGPVVLSSDEFIMNVLEGPTPEFNYSTIEATYPILTDINVTATLNSNGIIDQLCGIGYEVYKDGVLVENIADYGTLNYSVRQEGDTYYTGEIITGSGMIEVTLGEDQISAFTLGIFDTYCVNRNRPVDFTANFVQPGVYKLVSNLYGCTNEGVTTGTSFIASGCDGLEHEDMVAAVCDNPILINQMEVEMEVLAPIVEFTGLQAEYSILNDVNITANINSNGLIDQLCGIGYEIYKDGVLVEDIADYGTLLYSIRQEGDTYFNGEITSGSGMIEVTVGEDEIGAFTLGIFDNYCVNRNRPVDFTANFTTPGLYEMVSTLYSCSNVGTATGTSFEAVNCDGLMHDDYVAAICETPLAIGQESIEIVVLTPEIEFSEVLEDYLLNEDINVSANIYSNGLIDQVCGIGYEIYKDGVLVENLADYGTLTYSVRQEGDTYYEGVITNGSGMIEVTVGEDQIGGFTLGIFDNYCVNRNRPIDFTANFTAAGSYEMVSTIFTCSNAGVATGTSYVATNCDGLSHDDYVAETCETPVAIYDESVTINILSEIVINQQPISQTICSYETATITIDAEVTITETLSYQWLLDGVVIDGETSNTLETNIAGSYTCLLTAGDVEFLSEAAIVVVSEILLVMESEISICGDESVELDPGVYTSYLWQDNSIEQIFTVTETGTYTVIVTNEIGCTATASVEVTYHEIPEIDLGADGVFCSSEDITIAAPNASSWLWSTTETTQSITVLETGEYSCTITDEFGCQNSDAVEIDVLASPIVDLGEDLIVDEDQILIFGTQLGHSEYLWSTGDTTDFITLNASDLNLGTNVISVTVTGTNGCEGFDEVVITVIPGAAVDTELVNRFAVYPNPTSGILNIAGENIESSEIYNYLGQSILTTKENKIDLSSYPAGVYFVKILTSDKTITVKFIKE